TAGAAWGPRSASESAAFARRFGFTDRNSRMSVSTSGGSAERASAGHPSIAPSATERINFMLGSRLHFRQVRDEPTDGLDPRYAALENCILPRFGTAKQGRGAVA